MGLTMTKKLSICCPGTILHNVANGLIVSGREKHKDSYLDRVVAKLV